MKAEQFLLSFDEARKLLYTCTEYGAFANKKLKSTSGEKEIRYSFLKEREFSSIS